MATDIKELKRLAEAATPGKWEWKQDYYGDVQLQAPHGGGTVVMDFCRRGMQSGQPRFALCIDNQPRGKRGGILFSATEIIERDPNKQLRHPDADYIAAASPAVILDLIAKLERASAQAGVTDEQIDALAKPFSSFCTASGSREFDHQGFARAILSAHPLNATAQLAEAVPHGWKLVPVEPTAEQKIAGDYAGFWCGDKYRAMLNAAPTPPAAPAVDADAEPDAINARRYLQLRKHAGKIGMALWRPAPWTHESDEENQARLDLCLDEEAIAAQKERT